MNLFAGEPGGSGQGRYSPGSSHPASWPGSGSRFLRILTLTLCLFCPWLAAGQTEVGEYRLKAAVLFHFAQFVEWPPAALGNAGAPFVICIAGENPFHDDLEEAVQGKSIASRAVQIRHLKQTQAAQECHVLFVTKDDANLAGRVSTLRKTPVLTVGESDDFLEQGGIIRMFVEDRKIRFEINQGAAEAANLKISSRLLLLAKTVVGSNKR